MDTFVRRHYRRKKYGGYGEVRRHVRKVPGAVLKDYAGMNREAAKVMGFHPVPSKGVVLVNKSMPCREQKITALHEAVEERLMRSGWSYWDAHREALRAERGARPRMQSRHDKSAVIPYKSLVREHRGLVKALKSREPSLLKREELEQSKELKKYEKKVEK